MAYLEINITELLGETDTNTKKFIARHTAVESLPREYNGKSLANHIHRSQLQYSACYLQVKLSIIHTPWSRVLFANQTAVQPQKVPELFFVTQNFITFYTRARQWSLS